MLFILLHRAQLHIQTKIQCICACSQGGKLQWIACRYSGIKWIQPLKCMNYKKLPKLITNSVMNQKMHCERIENK